MKHQRHSIRLKDYDYSQPNIYFVTICAHGQRSPFGKISGEKVVLNEMGKIVDSHWANIPAHYANVSLDEYIIMLDHLHGLIIVSEINAGAMNGAPTAKSLANIISCFKAGVTRELGKSRLIVRYPIWQRIYYEHVVRSQDELNEIRQYIRNNPLARALKTENLKLE